MDTQESELIEKIRQQFDNAPYPRIPLDHSPKIDYQSLYIHNLVTAYYLRNQKVIQTDGKIILDAGCGSGCKSLVLAEANPGSKIVGIDLSEESVKLARQRLQYHGFDNVEFHALSIEDLPSLNQQFDYINCDEVLYLLPDAVVGLQAMQSVLKPDGIIRTNLHSSLQRSSFFAVQKVFKVMGLMDDNPREMEIELAKEIIQNLKDDVAIKARTWSSPAQKNEEWMLANYLLLGDKGSTVPEVFSALKAADLEFISMVYWRLWDLTDLFKEPNDLPAFLAMSLPDITVEQRLHLFELLHPVHRLIDFWCGLPNQAHSFVPVSEWTVADWQQAKVHLHPQIRTPQLKEELIKSIANHSSFQISRYVTSPTLVPILIESGMAACLLPLWEGAQPAISLAERWLKLRPLDLATLEPVSRERAFDEIKELLMSLEVFMYVLLERY
ncbi:MAG: class I SAM-dependent methyltransferase [Microcoleus sp. PH2017_29_MFU_D_A]|uniref:class I SAM-dependent methyltransferase n=1 Tax=unclassified Microcoleus TaxID=2642155 RepID=UPI001E08C47C|nr:MULTISPECIES: class I SAM-dependent methyltransferase [unclassified Microcoleus]TAG67338.1 MAG: class I SAM-dependent methyltransferase [Oscillatoriales cyanobacterium]MCC3424524.1 class I SAM-dependent methyltransferase [Microcoleus sp. PH2017_01_SCD_O_A]MCC3455038.1 class I SAM-dependent methyltransferase [Microcoleus sp. PH2017_08_TRC_O_A]MCC3575081.1 class I SAM-dependent methyltransferase [Microcoleus sp. PH2017_34_RAT_O_A]MCC3604225.1 class I SAM-dependent methyltransferase [Microcole